MKRIIIISAISFLFTACIGEREKEANNDTVLTSPSNTGNTPTTTASSNSPFYKIEDFTIDFFSPEYKSIVEDLLKNKNVVVHSKLNNCGGDCCNNTFKIEGIAEKKALYLYDSDCGENGFGNEQIFTVNGKPVKTRNFEFSANPNGLGFIIEEKILEFTNGKVITKERQKVVKDRNNLSLSDVPFKVSFVNNDELLKQKTGILFELNQELNKK